MFIRELLFGVAVGDALGVPVEFKEREYLSRNPVSEMTGFGTHHMPPGTWSDDSSLTFCLADALLYDFSLKRIAANFINWCEKGFWTPHGKVFDIGNTTYEAINQLISGIDPEYAGGNRANDNGNGSLMRILPLLIITKDLSVEERFDYTAEVSSITHRHIRSIAACFYYLEFARLILHRTDKFAAYHQLQDKINRVFMERNIPKHEISIFHRLLTMDIHEFREKDIHSSGYVMDTLEASVWCLLTTGSYREAVLRAVNLGGDTDTTGAVTGGLAALLYGYDSIPAEWIAALARREDIEKLAGLLAVKYADG